jgi:hypothetical protein
VGKYNYFAKQNKHWINFFQSPNIVSIVEALKGLWVVGLRVEQDTGAKSFS